MKVAFVYNHLSRQFMYRQSELIRLPVFKWWWLHRDEDGWAFHLLCFLNGVTDDWRWFSLQGVVTVGVTKGRPFLRFAPRMASIPLAVAVEDEEDVAHVDYEEGLLPF